MCGFGSFAVWWLNRAEKRAGSFLRYFFPLPEMPTAHSNTWRGLPGANTQVAQVREVFSGVSIIQITWKP